MTNDQRSTLLMALILSAMVLALNIVVVSSGMADSYYAEIQRWIETLSG